MKMAGIEISEEITSDQLEAMSGGELLKQEVRHSLYLQTISPVICSMYDAVLFTKTLFVLIGLLVSFF